MSRVLRAGIRTIVCLCLTAVLTHAVLVFLHIAPSNAVSQRYSAQINAWVYPLFEQNWKLFAPDPDSVNRRISARSAHTEADGTVRVSQWFDLSAVDHTAVEHSPFPSHTAQNELRRAWTSYLELHGGSDEPRSERAVMLQKYLRNIAVARMTEHADDRSGERIAHIQLRVVTVPVTAPRTNATTTAQAPPKPAETRLLPWWKVTPDGN
ncbi:DUF5819 family protein [Streptomyces sp. NBC_01498]|uniref:DUF5819 family protein n=1 Tax=Streptomyces sp. NBC_01498 TaxID=2975870 RepID=UPI002E7C095D|nr:DUF5819 family protein [Streptomyces sp. NBC_01498]WTL23468.1 DUF5819 family protein [Streptomyces sp. NBC_01498]